MYVVGNGQLKPTDAKIQALLEYPVPQNKQELMQFLGMAGYYRHFYCNFTVITAPLTTLLKKSQSYNWTADCEAAVQKLKLMLSSKPVLQAPDFHKQFSLMVDASHMGAGAALMQVDEKGIKHPVSYFSRKFNQHQVNYSTIEKEALALLLALQHFDVYLNRTLYLVIIYTDHNPLVLVNKMKILTSNYYDGVCYTSSTTWRFTTSVVGTTSSQTPCPEFELILQPETELLTHYFIQNFLQIRY